jgi:hypothetical protein
LLRQGRVLGDFGETAKIDDGILPGVSALAVGNRIQPAREWLMKRLIQLSAVLVGVTIAGTAFAQTGPGNSTPGIDRYNENPGRQQATEVGAQCGSGAGSGAFGFFGRDNSLAGGANGTQTGLNNSAVCGNRPN